MSNKTLLILAVVAAALGIYIVAFERGSVTTGETEGRANTLLPNFVRTRVTRVEFQVVDNPRVVLERREADAGEEVLAGAEPEYVWFLVQPVSASANLETVNALLGSIEWARKKIELSDVSGADLRNFGLENPRAQLRFTVGREVVEVAIGSDDPTGAGIYAQIGDQSEVYVTGDDLLNAVRHDASHFRSKDLFPDHTVRVASRLSIESASQTLAFTERDGLWWMEDPQSMLASDTALTNLLRALDDTEPTHFVESAEVDLQGFVVSGAVADEGEFRLRIGGPCAREGSREGERYAQVDGGPIVCLVPPAELERSVEAWQERRLLPLREAEIGEFEISGGNLALVLDRDEDLNWVHRFEDGELRPADGTAVEEWLSGLEAARASGFVEPDGSGAELPTQGTIRVRREDRADFVLALSQDDDGYLVSRTGETRRMRVPAEVAELFHLSPVRFRPRSLLFFADDELRGLEVRRGDHVERIARGDNGFEVTEPIETRADASALRELSRRLGTLHAERFVAETELGDVELDVSVEFATATHRLRIYPDDRARLDEDPAVFLLEPEIRTLLAGPLVSRDLAVSRDEIAAVTLELATGTTDLIRDESEYREADGAPVSPERVEALIDGIARLRAVGVLGYAPVSGSPRASITVSGDTESAPVHELHFYGAVPGSVEDGERVRLAGVDAEFVISPESAVALLSPIE